MDWIQGWAPFNRAISKGSWGGGGGRGLLKLVFILELSA